MGAELTSFSMGRAADAARPFFISFHPGSSMRVSSVMIAIAALLFLSPPAAADTDARTALRISQQALGRTLADTAFVDQAGQTVRLSAFHGKPVVVGYIYTSCAQSCPVVIETLKTAVSVARDALGAEGFHVAVLGFDVGRDTPDAMASFARRMGLPSDWTLLSGDLPAVAAFTDAAGFTFFRSPKGYDHMDQVTVADKDGVIYRQVYGATFDPPLLVDPLKDLIYGTRAPWSSPRDLWKKIKLFCTVYDPADGRYRFDYTLFVQFFVGGTVILFLVGFVVRNWIRLYRRDKRTTKPLSGAL